MHLDLVLNDTGAVWATKNPWLALVKESVTAQLPNNQWVKLSLNTGYEPPICWDADPDPASIALANGGPTNLSNDNMFKLPIEVDQIMVGSLYDVSGGGNTVDVAMTSSDFDDLCNGNTEVIKVVRVGRASFARPSIRYSTLEVSNRQFALAVQPRNLANNQVELRLRADDISSAGGERGSWVHD